MLSAVAFSIGLSNVLPFSLRTSVTIQGFYCFPKQFIIFSNQSVEEVLLAFPNHGYDKPDFFGF